MKFKMRIGWWELLVAIVVGLMVIVTVKYFGKVMKRSGENRFY